ncbi:hypothetical protein HY639_01415 [Candidatus Woesearchaeota archaeon]|nr:hypothetical protein [Candidatus Woesearchaeota archaeon]
MDVSIRKVEPVNPLDERGPTYEWCRGIPGRQISIYLRKQGASFGAHFHTGSDPSKNPELFFLISGKMHCHFLDKRINESLECVVEGGTELLIVPLILHSMKALTDVVFVEYRVTEFDKSHTDTYPASQYDEFIARI